MLLRHACFTVSARNIIQWLWFHIWIAEQSEGKQKQIDIFIRDVVAVVDVHLCTQHSMGHTRFIYSKVRTKACRKSVKIWHLIEYFISVQAPRKWNQRIYSGRSCDLNRKLWMKVNYCKKKHWFNKIMGKKIRNQFGSFFLGLVFRLLIGKLAFVVPIFMPEKE